MRLKAGYQIVVLVIVVMGVYYSAISGGINSVDDAHIMEAYGVNGNLTLKDILIPGNNFYYRPFVELSYYLDYHLWDLDKNFMHLENIILHVFNTVLIFLAAKIISSRSDIDMPGLPFLSALLFALHPINTEAVCWIAGRTDPFAALFVLLSLYFILKGLNDNRQFYVYLSMLFLLLGVLTKEIAILFLPSAVLIILYWQNKPLKEAQQSCRTATIRYILPIIVVTGVCLATLLLNYHYRNGTNSVTRLLHSQGVDIVSSSRLVLKVFGYYVKKLFIPAPLNFAINTVNNNYIWLGIFCIIGLLVILYKRHIISALFVVGFFLITPALLVAQFNISWTLVAERYLYLPSAFFSIGTVGFIYLLFNALNKQKVVFPCVSLLLFPAAFVTLDRNNVWQDNLTLYQDAVNKSPEFGTIRNELAIALKNAGRIEEANDQLQIAKKLNKSDDVSTLIDLNLINLQIKNKTPEQANEILLSKIRDKGSANLDLLFMLKRVDEGRLASTADKTSVVAIAKEIIDTNDHIHERTKDPYCLYRNGQLSLLIGDTQKAVRYFNNTADTAPEGAYYKESAKKLAFKVGTQ